MWKIFLKMVAAQGVRLMKLGEGQFVSTVAKVKEEDENDEDNEDSDETTSSETATEEVVDDQTPGNAIHTEVEEETSKVKTDDNDDRIDVRQDFMDRVNEDIESASDNEDDNE